MSGILIIGGLLRAYAPLIATVPVARIKAGALADDAPMPSLLLRTISATDLQTLKRSSTPRVTERVAVAVRAASYDDQRAIIKLVRRCCAGMTGTIGGFPNVSILTAGLGPDARGPNDSFEQTQDFLTSFGEPA